MALGTAALRLRRTRNGPISTPLTLSTLLNSEASPVATSMKSTGSHGFSWCVSRASRILAAYSAMSPTPGRLAMTRTLPVVAAWSMKTDAGSSSSTPCIRSAVERRTATLRG